MANDILNTKPKSVSGEKKGLVYAMYINTREKLIEIMNVLNGDIDNAQLIRLPYKGRSFDEEFYDKIKNTLNKYLEDKPDIQSSNVYLILPDGCVSNDVFNIPTISKNKMNESLKNTIENQYRNHKDLQIKTIVLGQNKQYTTYSIKSIKRELLINIYSVLANCKMYAKNTTYYGNALLDGVLSLRFKSKNHTFLFLDIKDNSSEFVFCYKGKTMGTYPLQFGYSILLQNKVISENMLHNHLLAEITVLNAMEKAKAKQLTMLNESYETENSDKEENIVPELDAKVIGKKAPRKFPKNLQREIPTTPEGMAVENFRIFVKWSLLLIKENSRPDLVAKCEYVLVNIPRKFNYVLEKTNLEIEENKVEFIPLNIEEDGKIMKI